MNNFLVLKDRNFQLFLVIISLFYGMIPNSLFAQCGADTILGTGTFVWVAPADITSNVTVQAWGGGGGGGDGGGTDASGGGGGGAFAGSSLAVVASTSYTIIVGAGGTIGAHGANSSFGPNLVVAQGGRRGVIGSPGAGGTVAASIGTTRFAGGSGGGGVGNDDGSGGGGAAGTTANGGTGGNATNGGPGGSGGIGGSVGGGNGGQGGVEDGADAKCGTGVGGGGGGGGERGSLGNTGAHGQVTISYTTSACPGGITLTYRGGGYTAMTSASSKTICSGSSVGLVLTGGSSYTWRATANGNVTGESTTNQTSSTINNTLTNTTSAVQTVTYTVTPGTTCNSEGVPQVVNITVNPLPTMTSANTATICSGGEVNIPLTATTSTTTATTFTWIASNNANTTGESTASQSTSTLTNTITNTSASVQTVTYSVTPTNSCGTGTQQVVNVTVDPPLLMTSASTATICGGSTVGLALTSDDGAATFTWKAASNVNIIGESTTDQTGSPISDVLDVTSMSDQTVTYSVTPNNGACGGTTQVVTVTVETGPGDTAVFGNNEWNVYAWNAGGAGGGIPGTGAFTYNYAGNYTIPDSLSFDTRLAQTHSTPESWDQTQSPSDALGYSGCTLADDFHSYVFKREGFPCGVYEIYTGNDDFGALYIDNTIVWTSGGFQDGALAWTGALGSTSTVELMVSEHGGNSFGKLQFVYTALAITSSSADMCVTDAARALTANDGTSVWSGTGVSGASFDPATAGVGTHTITYTRLGCIATQDITVDPLPTATSGGSQTICVGGTATVSGASSTDGTILWTHDGAGSITADAATLTPTYTSAAGDAGNTVTLTMTVTSNNACGAATAAATYSVVVMAQPTASSGGSQTICVGSDAIVSGASSSNGTILWTHNGTGSISANATTLTPTYTSAAGDEGNTVTLTMTVSNTQCTDAIATYSVVVNSGPTASAGGSQTICVGSVASVSGATSANGTILWTEDGTGTITAGATTLTPDYTSAAGDAGNTVTLTITVSDGICPDATATYSVVVNAQPTASAGGSQTICHGSIATVSGATSSNGTILWTEDGAGSITVGATTLTPDYTSVLADAGNTVTLTMTVSNSPCIAATATYSVVVNQDASINLTSAVGTDSQSVCLNTAITDIEYTTNNVVTNVTATGLPAGVTTSFNAGTGVFTISGTPSVSGVYAYTVTTTGSCVQTDTTGSIRVGIGLSSTVGTDTQSVCKNSAITAITYAIGGSGASATTTGLPDGVSGNLTSPGVFTISGTPSVEGTYNYTITTSAPCAASSLYGTITVGLGLPDDTSNIQSVCKNTAIVDIDYDVVGGGTPSTTGLPAGLTTNFNTGTNVFTISGTPSVEGTYNYTVTTTGSCTDQSSLTGTITVGLGLPDDTTNIQSVCKNAAIIDIDYDVVGGGTPLTSGLPAGLTTNFNAGTNVFTISGTPSIEGIYNYTVTTTGSCTSQSSLTGTITVGLGLPDDTTNIQSVCKNAAIIDIDYDVVGGGTPLTSGLPAGLTTNFNAGTNVFTISGIPSVEGTYNYTVTTTGSCTTQSSLTGTITVGLGLPDDTTNIQSVCKNAAIIDIDYDVVGGGTPLTTGLPAGLTTNFNAGTNVFTISGTPSVEGTYDYTVTTTGSCTDQSSLTGTITVGLGLPDDTTNIQSVCKNDPILDINYDVVGGGTPLTTGLPAGLTTNFIAGTNVFTISGTPSVEGTYNYTVTTTGSCTTQSSLTGTITVGLGLPDDTTNIQSVCKNAAIIDIDYDVVGGGTPLTIGLPAGLTTNFNAGTNVFTISGIPSVEGTYNYTVTTTGSCTSQSSLTGTITVGLGLPDDTTNIQSVCKNAAIIDIDYDVVGGGTPLTTGLPAGLTINFNAGTNVFTISGTPSVEGTYDYTVITTGSCTDQSSLTGTITVGIGLATPGTDTQSVCRSTPITDIVYNVVGGGTPTVSGLPPGVAGVLTNSTVFTIGGTPSVEGTFNYTITTSGTCTDQSTLTGLITVGMSSPLGNNNIQNVCKNAAIADIVYNFVGGGTPTITSLPPGVAGVLTNPGEFTVSGTPSVEGIFIYTVTTVGTCATESSFTGTITVGGGLDTAGGSNVQNICKNTAITPILYNIIGGGATVSGLPGGVSGSMTTAGSPGVFTISGTASIEGIFNYTVTTVGTCATESSFTGIITVGGGLDTTGGSNVQNICKNTSITPILYNIIGGGATVSGLPDGVTGAMTTAGSPGVFTISGTASIEGIFNYTVTTIGTCATESSFTGTITVGGGLDPTGGSNVQNICKNTPISPILYNIIGGGATVSGLPGGVNGSMTTAGSPGVFTISGTASTEGIFNYTVTTVGTCATESSFTGTITVGGGLDPTGGSNVQDICKNTAITPILYNIIGGSATVSGLPNGITGAMTTAGSPGVFTISGTGSVEGIFVYTVTTVGTCATESSFTGTITVGGGLIIPGGSNVQTVCRNAAITPILYRVIGGSATVSGLPGGVTGAMTTAGSPGVFTISGTPSVAGIFTYTLTTVGTCVVESSFTGTLTVDEATATVITNGTNAQTLCSNNTIADISYTIGGTGTGATVSTLPAGLTSSFNNGVFTVSGTPNLTEGTYTYTVTPTGGTCPPSPEIFTITIENPIAEFTADPNIGSPVLQANFTNTSQNANMYEWSFGEGTTSTAFDTSYTYLEKGIYTVRLIASNNALCPDTATTTITVYKIVVPNVFTPNGDNINDVFSVNEVGVASIDVTIYNRWGTKIYEWNIPGGYWDGINNITGIPSEDGTYFYILKITDINGKVHDETGAISLIR